MLLNHISDNARKAVETVKVTDKATGSIATFRVPGYAGNGKPALKALAATFADALAIKGSTPNTLCAQDDETVMERGRQFSYSGNAMVDLVSRIAPTAQEKAAAEKAAAEKAAAEKAAAEKAAAEKAELERVEKAAQEKANNAALNRANAPAASSNGKKAVSVS